VLQFFSTKLNIIPIHMKTVNKVENYLRVKGLENTSQYRYEEVVISAAKKEEHSECMNDIAQEELKLSAGMTKVKFPIKDIKNNSKQVIKQTKEDISTNNVARDEQRLQNESVDSIILKRELYDIPEDNKETLIDQYKLKKQDMEDSKIELNPSNRKTQIETVKSSIEEYDIIQKSSESSDYLFKEIKDQSSFPQVEEVPKRREQGTNTSLKKHARITDQKAHKSIDILNKQIPKGIKTLIRIANLRESKQ